MIERVVFRLKFLVPVFLFLSAAPLSIASGPEGSGCDSVIFIPPDLPDTMAVVSGTVMGPGHCGDCCGDAPRWRRFCATRG